MHSYMSNILYHNRVLAAIKAMEVGIVGIEVSNDGARQLFLTLGQTTLQNFLVFAVRGEILVLFDRVIRKGTEVFKVSAHGAQAVLVGRPVVFGLAAKGDNGVRRVIEMLKAELKLTMALSGLWLSCGLAGQASGLPELMAWIAPELNCGLIGVTLLVKVKQQPVAMKLFLAAAVAAVDVAEAVIVVAVVVIVAAVIVAVAAAAADVIAVAAAAAGSYSDSSLPSSLLFQVPSSFSFAASGAAAAAAAAAAVAAAAAATVAAAAAAVDAAAAVVDVAVAAAVDSVDAVVATSGAEEKRACLPYERVDLTKAPLVTFETVNYVDESRHVDFAAAAAVVVAVVVAAAEERAVGLLVVVLQALKPQTRDFGRSVMPEDFQEELPTIVDSDIDLSLDISSSRDVAPHEQPLDDHVYQSTIPLLAKKPRIVVD
ncbi:unnamed protein product [Dovyalis caffra]|uniref:FMN hydroxy acid dehydrogenase domain-containing protein n=1 Tax=Dovyalis caffra TaxID=77055 RepID=A0AAV1SR34_9ROSI|nr:unnamed protein product [Dovyalis caffra]